MVMLVCCLQLELELVYDVSSFLHANFGVLCGVSWVIMRGGDIKGGTAKMPPNTKTKLRACKSHTQHRRLSRFSLLTRKQNELNGKARALLIFSMYLLCTLEQNLPTYEYTHNSYLLCLLQVYLFWKINPGFFAIGLNLESKKSHHDGEGPRDDGGGEEEKQQ
jgi:hypothetical protein